LNLIDYHVHTTFSEDGVSTPEACAKAAADRNLSGIIFTEHLEFIPPPDSPEPAYVPARVLPAREYGLAVAAVREQWRGRLSVGLGVELGLEPHNLDAVPEFLATAELALDYVLGSLHFIRGVLVQEPAFADRLGSTEAARLYFERLLAGVKRASSLGVCDVIGHLDLVKRSPTFGGFRLRDQRAHVEETLRVIIRDGLGLEVNTSGLRQSPGEPYPGLDTLKLYRELGGEIVTVGSDSHTAATVGLGSAEALEFIRAAGFRHITLFSARTPRRVAI